MVEASAGRPVARARVSVEPAGAPGPSLSAWSDSSGQFAFPSLPSGAYLLSAKKDGFAAAKFGQTRWDRPGTPIVLSETAEFRGVLALRRLAAVSGEVTDENRAGLAGCAVYAYRFGPRLRQARSVLTDDRGVFRLAGLEPGRYLIRTAPRELEDGQGLLPTWYGQTTAASDARPVDVRLDDEAGGVRIQPLPGRLSVLSVGINGASAATVWVDGDAGRREGRVQAGGQARFDQLPPGTYEVVAESVNPARAGRARVTVEGENEQVLIAMQPAPVVLLRCQDATGGTGDFAQAAVFARRAGESGEQAAVRIVCGEERNLGPGSWELAASAPPERYLSSVSGAEPSGDHLRMALEPGRRTELALRFSTGAGAVKGTVRTADGETAPGAPVALRALAAELRARTGGVRQAHAGLKGEYRFGGLAPGRYEVLSAFDLPEPGEEWRPNPAARTVEVTGEAEKDVDLEVAR